jgi:hypothetical protein
VGNGVGVWFGAGTADDNFHSVTGGIDEAPVTRRERDREQVGITRCTEGQSIAFRVGGEAATEVAMQGFVVGEVASARRRASWIHLSFMGKIYFSEK